MFSKWCNKTNKLVNWKQGVIRDSRHANLIIGQKTLLTISAFSQKAVTLIHWNVTDNTVISYMKDGQVSL